jgi:GH24 family phage-related lysozyme (muramidase)
MGQHMTTKFSTSQAGYDLIKHFEGCKLTAYKPTPASNWTIGWGQEGRMPDGRPVVGGLTITQQEADDALQYFVRNVVDPMVRKHFVLRAQHEHDACASWVYNVRHDRLERGEYSLPQLVNRAERDEDSLITLWLRYIHTPGAQNGLWKRRLAEVLLFFGLPWNAPAVMGFINTARYFDASGNARPSPAPDFLISVAEEAAEKIKPIPSEPDPPKKAKAPVAVKEEPLPGPIDPTLPPKPIEKSHTAKVINRQSRGKETASIGGLGLILVTLAQQIEIVGRSLDGIGMDTMLKVAVFAFIGLAGFGGWMWWSGRNEAWLARHHPDGTPKVQDPKY